MDLSSCGRSVETGRVLDVYMRISCTLLPYILLLYSTFHLLIHFTMIAVPRQVP
ncbi:hypothetical protein PHLGIDRAFT_270703 [Phlebiopsis gigantea 11061_1 CR5-6]|uniref:Uncharacterized protein n=1 Tax=Phlebiopsis gigantea (strain 11061_1 CR5-6) TaxID=745531 RepID=A0A0C3S175_PHLG1|nr:hypothetical protein PHLGIDRAFT_270703 [Phlebiopsis gigantea 11061_1 CR5-6]